MAISGIIEFHASSGAASHPWQLDPFVAGSGLEWNRLGLFDTSCPGSFVTVNTYQNTTYTVREDGNAVDGAINTASGQLSNNKYVNSSSVNPNSSGSVGVSTLTIQDATLRVRFTEPSGNAVITQNAELLCVQFNASSGVDDEDAVPTGVTVQAFEVGVDTAWEKLSDDAADNTMAFGDRAGSSIIHDFHMAISVAPILTGQRIDFGFLFQLEYI